MRNPYVVAIGASAGGLEAVRTLAAALPADFPSPICIVLHTAPESPGLLHEILNRAGPLTAVTVSNSERLTPGRIYVAPPDSHLVIEPGRLRATKGPRENRFRPAIDPLFRSAAQVFGPAAIGVVLTGNLDDGTAGLATIKQLGGIAIAQDPDDALFPSMPMSAIQHVAIDYQVTVPELAPLLVRLTATPIEDLGDVKVPDHIDIEVKIAKELHPRDAGLESIGVPSPYACPECHGVLLQLQDGERVRFRCHTGHAYSIESLVAGVNEGLEVALWTAIRAFEEATLLLERMAGLLDEKQPERAAALLRQAADLRRRSDDLRVVTSRRAALVSED